METSNWSGKLKLAKQWYLDHEKQLVPIALLGGFIFDWLTVTRIDQLYENILLVVYMLIAAGGIAIIHLYDGGRLTAPLGKVRRERALSWLRVTAPLIVQFAFGGLFSVFLVFYAQAGSFTVSWIFILLLVGLMVGNELLREHYQQLSIQIGVLFFCVFLFSIFFLPIMFSRIGVAMFIVAGIVSLVLILLYFNFLGWLVPDYAAARKRAALAAVVSVYAVVNLLYFSGVVPPLPLSIKSAEVVHSVERLGEDQYVVEDETESLRDRLAEDWLWFVHDEIHIEPSDPVYFFSSVFAPSDLDLTITHQWQRFDETRQDWVDTGRISFPVRGGRAAGYRGFSLKRNVSGGWWRVSVQMPDGRVVGRTTFEIIPVSSSEDRPEIDTKIW